MQEKSDAQLLREYAEQGVESAFAALVTRYTNLVFSAAARQTDSPDIAAEITQSVFISIAQNARPLLTRLTEDATIAGWLCRAARNQCLKRRRDDFRRHSHERQAMEQMISSSEPSPDWEKLRPVLDEAMSELNDADHDAIVMRFFNRQDLRSVGAALGVSEDTAQKRVSRALDKLRALLSRRGVGTSTAALAALLSANAVQAAPAALLPVISAAVPAAASTFAATTTITATQAIAMTTIQKTIIATAFAAAIGTGIYEARNAAILRAEIASLREQQAALETSRAAEVENDDLHQQLAALRGENERLRQSAIEILRLRGELARSKAGPAPASGDAGLEAAFKILASRATLLKQRLEQTRDQQIPELQLLTEADWFDAVKNLERLSTDEDFRRAFHALRRTAKFKFAQSVEKALGTYVQANGGQLPGELSQLKPYFQNPVDDAILQRYGLLHTGKLSDLPANTYLVAETAPPVDELHDTTFEINLNGTRTSNFSQMAAENAFMKYVEANNGRLPTDSSQVLPYAKNPIDAAEVQELIDRIPAGVTTLDQLNGMRATSVQ